MQVFFLFLFFNTKVLFTTALCLLCGIYKARARGYLSSQVFTPYILVSIDIFDVSGGTTSSHSKEMQTAAYGVKSDIHGGWMASSVLTAALLLLVLRVPVLYGIQH